MASREGLTAVMVRKASVSTLSLTATSFDLMTSGTFARRVNNRSIELKRWIGDGCENEKGHKIKLGANQKRKEGRFYQ